LQRIDRNLQQILAEANGSGTHHGCRQTPIVGFEGRLDRCQSHGVAQVSSPSPAAFQPEMPSPTARLGRISVMGMLRQPSPSVRPFLLTSRRNHRTLKHLPVDHQFIPSALLNRREASSIGAYVANTDEPHSRDRERPFFLTSLFRGASACAGLQNRTASEALEGRNTGRQRLVNG
jgi:hypothetical protein